MSTQEDLSNKPDVKVDVDVSEGKLPVMEAEAQVAPLNKESRKELPFSSIYHKPHLTAGPLQFLACITQNYTEMSTQEDLSNKPDVELDVDASEEKLPVMEADAQVAPLIKESRKGPASGRIHQQTCPTTLAEEDFFGPSHTEADPEGLKRQDSSIPESLDVESSLSEFKADDHDKPKPRKFRFPWLSWSRKREWWTAVGCLSSVVVLTIRLLVDREPSAYLIHSVVVFFDMLLIHLFTNCGWLSVAGELITIVSFLAFHFTKETIFELTETTMIAIICSLHMIHSRSKALNKMEILEEVVENMSQRQSQSVRKLLGDNTPQNPATLGSGMEEGGVQVLDEDESCDRIVLLPDCLDAPSKHELRKRPVGCGLHFFEHFLDGSAGVMYTSFAGLIIDEIIHYGN